MKLIEQIRLENARQILNTHEPGFPAGNKAEMGRRVGVARQVIGFYLADYKDTGKPMKAIGADMARAIEAAYGKPGGWLDNDHSVLSHVRQDDDTIDVPALSRHDEGHDDVMRLTRLSKAWIRSNTSCSAVEKLAVTTAAGDSMAPTFADGSILLIDRGVVSVKADAVYVLANGHDLWVKRVARRPEGGIVLISDNKTYPTMTIDNPSGIEVVGRVIAAWNAVKL